MQRLILFFILLFFLPYFVEAHKPKVLIERYGNVKTYFSSNFNFAARTIESQELKIQVIGKLAKRMMKELHCNDTVLIEYKKRYDGERIFILENNTFNYKIAGLESGIITKSNGKGLAIRIIDDDLDIINVLKLVEYSVLNRNTINKSLQPLHFRYNKTDEMIVSANSENFIEKITGNHSDLVQEIIAEETELLNNGFAKTRISWKNGVFLFGYNDIPPSSGNYISYEKAKYILKDFNYYIESYWSDFFVIFYDSDRFVYFDGDQENTSSQKLDQPTGRFYAFSLGKDRLINKIILMNTFIDASIYIYHINKKLLQKIE